MGLGKTLRVSVLVLSMGLSLAAQASIESGRIQNILQNRMYLRAGSAVVEANSLVQLYTLRNFEPIWFQNGVLTAEAQELKVLLQNAGRHGLRTQDYWSTDVDNLSKNLTANNWITFELLASEAYIRYADNLANGRFLAPAVTPEDRSARFQGNFIDDDIKYKDRATVDYAYLNQAVSNGQNLGAQLDTLAPQTPMYQRMVRVLNRLRQIMADRQWGNIDFNGTILRPNDTSTIIPIVKRRLTFLGYYVGNETNVYDQAMVAAVRRYRDANKMRVTTEIGQSFFDKLLVPLANRITQLEVNLEKLRWLGHDLEAKYLFVNTGFQELKAIENGQPVLSMRTVNGQVLRHTPMMRNSLNTVILNPTWTVPESIFFKDKIPMLRRDPNYLRNHNMHLFQMNSVTGGFTTEVDATTINWSQIITPAQAAQFQVVQGPGIDNALGVVKFPMANTWDIYLHDTNQRDLLAQNEQAESRLVSSGCIRLEKPLDLAAYLLSDKPNYTADRIRAAVPSRAALEAMQRQPIWDPYYSRWVDPVSNQPTGAPGNTMANFVTQSVDMTRSIPVYLLYLTADVNENGEVRFAEDIYGVDARLRQLINGQRAQGETF